MSQLKERRNANGKAEIHSGFVPKAVTSSAAGLGCACCLLSILSRYFHSHSLVPIEVENPFPYCAIVSLWQMNINCINFQ